MSPQLAARLSFWKDPNMERIYLYDEAHAPETVKEMGRYIAKLVLLAKQRVEYSDVFKIKAELKSAFNECVIRTGKFSSSEDYLIRPNFKNLAQKWTRT
jgi:hypothetical protein